MQTENQKERLVELLKEADANPFNREITNFEDLMEMIADHLLANCVVVLPENAMFNVNSRMVIEEETMLIVEKETYTISWEKEKYCMAEPKGKTIEIPKWTYDEHKGETE